MAESKDESQKVPSSVQGLDSEQSVSDRTRVDLGDDLIEKTATVHGFVEPGGTEGGQPPTSAFPSSRDEVEDLLQSATILINEGIIEEAKKVLRRIILVDPRHALARQKLDEIHETELRQILEGASSGRRKSSNEENPFRGSSEDTMRGLDRDLRLGIFEDSELGKPAAAELSLFKTKDALDEFAVRLEGQLAGVAGRERIDMGIAFLEMGLHDLAARQFKAAGRDLTQSRTAASLLAYTLIAAGRPFEAVLCLETVLGDAELQDDDKVEFLYLMGRAHEALRKLRDALEWYAQAYRLDPQYRDVSERMKVVTETVRSRGREERD